MNEFENPSIVHATVSLIQIGENIFYKIQGLGTLFLGANYQIPIRNFRSAKIPLRKSFFNMRFDVTRSFLLYHIYRGGGTLVNIGFWLKYIRLKRLV